MQIRNEDSVEVFRGELRDHSGKVRKTFVIYGERAVLLLVVNIQINNVGRDMIRSETICDFDHSRLRCVTVTRLLKPQSPHRRKWHSSSQPCVSFYYVLRSRSVKYVVIQRSAHSAKGIRIGQLLAKVKAATPGIVEEDSERTAGPEGHEVRDSFIEGIGGLLETIGIRVPQCESLFAPIQRAGLVSQAEVVFIERHRFVEPKGVAMKFNGLYVLLKNVAVAVGDR